MTPIFPAIQRQLRNARRRRGLSQAQLAERIGRGQNRISEFERDLERNRMGRDRLTLLADICDALGVVPVLVPRADVERVKAMIGDAGEKVREGQPTSAFEDLFVDLGGDEPD